MQGYIQAMKVSQLRPVLEAAGKDTTGKKKDMQTKLFALADVNVRLELTSYINDPLTAAVAKPPTCRMCRASASMESHTDGATKCDGSDVAVACNTECYDDDLADGEQVEMWECGDCKLDFCLLCAVKLRT